MTNYKHIDLNYLEDLALGSKDFLEDMISSFLKSTPESLQKMEEALNGQDWNRVGSIAHKLKTSFSFMGMEETVKNAKTLQDYGLNSTNIESIPELVEALKTSFAEAKSELEAELVSLKA